MRLIFSFLVLSSHLHFHVLASDPSDTSPLKTLTRRAPALTSHVLTLEQAPFRRPLTPTSNHLSKRFEPSYPFTKSNSENEPNQSEPNPQEYGPPTASLQHQLLTLGGRVYMTNISLSSSATPYTLVIDTGSSDTWIASSDFECKHPDPDLRESVLLERERCGFGGYFDEDMSTSFNALSSVSGGTEESGGNGDGERDGETNLGIVEEVEKEYTFSVRYADGEFVVGDLGVEELEMGGLKTRQVIGVAERGWWMGDGISAGLMGLAYPGLASRGVEWGYRNVVYSLLQDSGLEPIFSLALSRPTREFPQEGGLLALGGIPDVPHDEFVYTPIIPLRGDTYAFYSIQVDGFEVLPRETPLQEEEEEVATWKREVAWSSRFSGAGWRAGVKEKRRSVIAHSQDGPENVWKTEEDLQREQAKQNANLNTPIETVIDSGSTLIYLPDKITDYIATLFSPPATFDARTGLYMVACDAEAPSVGVIISGRTFWIDERDMIPGADDYGDAPPPPDAVCVMAAQRKGRGDAVLGDVWLKNVVVVFDLGVDEVGVAARGVY